MRYTADFETNNHEEDCRVWAWGICDTLTYEFNYGNTIESFMKFVLKNGPNTYYFHNLKFDAQFLLSYLFTHGWEYAEGKILHKQFRCLLSNKGQFYSLTLGIKDNKGKIKHINFLDSFKIIPLGIDKIAKDFNLPIRKGSIDYNKFREKGYIMDENEKKYLKNDVEIAARALNTFFDQGLDKMTIGANALEFYKNQIGEKKFKRLFPIPAYDQDIRQSYKGGWTFLNPKYKGRAVRKGLVLDINSLYPYVMREKPLPYGEGIFFNGKYVEDKVYNLYIQMLTCQFEIKEGHLPTVQIKGTMSFVPTEYLTSSNGNDVTLCMTSVDLQLLFDHYNVYNVKYHSGWKFKSSKTLFREYVDYWANVKIQADRDGNKGLRTIAKLYLNNLYGKFGKNPIVQEKIPYMDENGVVKFKLTEPQKTNPIYIPVASFVTAWARDKTIRAAQANYHRFIYADTDSLHLEGREIPTGLEIDDFKIGAWKIESKFSGAKFLRAKSYIELIDGKIKVTCAGLPKGAVPDVKYCDFKPGFVTYKGLKQKIVKGGCVLKESKFEIIA